MGETVVDPFSSSVLDDPYDTYARWRTEGPVHTVPELGIHLVLSHSAVVEAVARTDDFSNNLTAFFMIDDTGKQVLVDATGGGGIDVLATADEPVHGQQRKSLNRPFGVPRMAGLEPKVRTMVSELLGRAVPNRRFDWVDAVASLLPIRAIALLLGLPDEDSPQLKFWSDEGIELLSGFADAARLHGCMAHVEEFTRYLATKLETPAPDAVIATIAAAMARGEYDRDNATAMLVQLVGAGSDSTSGLTGSCALALARDPQLQQRLRDEPACVPPFVEEVLRLETPFRGHFRHVLRDTEIGDVPVRAGERLLLVWAAANRDPAVYERPDEIDLERDTRTHLGFGWGIHHCIGAPLARLEARVAVEELLASTRDVALDPNATPRWVRSLFLRRLAELPLVVSPA
jgi:cytochrome P450